MEPYRWEYIDYSIFNSEENIEKLLSIINLVQIKFKDDNDFKDVLESIEETRKWNEENLKEIEFWLDEEIQKFEVEI